MDLIPREFFDRPGPEVAPDLLGLVLEHETADGLVAVMLTEVEAQYETVLKQHTIAPTRGLLVA